MSKWRNCKWNLAITRFGKIIEVGNGKESDDKAVIDYALKYGSYFITLDKNYNKFIELYNNNEQLAEFLENKSIDVLFQGKELIFKTMPFEKKEAS